MIIKQFKLFEHECLMKLNTKFKCENKMNQKFRTYFNHAQQQQTLKDKITKKERTSLLSIKSVNQLF